MSKLNSNLGASRTSNKNLGLEDKKWKVWKVNSGLVIVFPLNDVDEHRLKDPNCNCNPRVELFETGSANQSTIIVHNAFDQREKAEAFMNSGCLV